MSRTRRKEKNHSNKKATTTVESRAYVKLESEKNERNFRSNFQRQQCECTCDLITPNIICMMMPTVLCAAHLCVIYLWAENTHGTIRSNWLESKSESTTHKTVGWMWCRDSGSLSTWRCVCRIRDESSEKVQFGFFLCGVAWLLKSATITHILANKWDAFCWYTKHPFFFSSVSSYVYLFTPFSFNSIETTPKTPCFVFFLHNWAAKHKVHRNMKSSWEQLKLRFQHSKIVKSVQIFEHRRVWIFHLYYDLFEERFRNCFVDECVCVWHCTKSTTLWNEWERKPSRWWALFWFFLF